jgi:hypothetical protein
MSKSYCRCAFFSRNGRAYETLVRGWGGAAMFFRTRHSDDCVVVCHFGFNLHFPSNR